MDSCVYHQTALDDECIARFENEPNDERPHASLSELRALAAGCPSRLRVSRVQTATSLAGIAVWTLRDRRYRGVPMRVCEPFGADLFDYNRLYANDPDTIRRLLRAMAEDSRALGADALLLENLLLSEDEATALGGVCRPHQTLLFDASKDGTGWNGLLGRKSVRRHRNKAARNLRYRVDIQRGCLPEKDITAMAVLHRERWALDGVDSPFSDPQRILDYLAFPENKVLVSLWAGTEPLAMCYAIRHGNTLLWHTPVVNIKFLDYSPLEVLLFEVAADCEASGVRVLDLGIGDEPYKARFANAQRATYSIFLPLTVRAHAVRLGSRVVNPASVKAACLEARHAAGRAKDRALTRVNKVLCYEALGPSHESVSDAGFALITSWPEFVDYARGHAVTPTRQAYDRFREGSWFAALHAGSVAVSTGWVSPRPDFWIEEINRVVRLEQGLMLYDFNTPPAHRRRGYYTELLRRLRTQFADEMLGIFALSGNTPSNKAIVRAGFQPRALWAEAPKGDAIG